MSGMDELVTWMRAQLDDDERKIASMEREEGRVRTAPIFQGHPPNWLAGVDIFVSSKRWRAEVDAKRRILDECVRTLDHEDHGYVLAEFVIRTMGLAYADRDGYREEWRP